MPNYTVQSPSGKSYTVTAPADASQADVLAYAQSQYGHLENDDSDKNSLLELGKSVYQHPLQVIPGVAENVAQAAGSAVFGAAAGLYGLGKGAVSAAQGRAFLGPAVQGINDVNNSIPAQELQPQTDVGQKLGNVIGLIPKYADVAGAKVSDVTGSPALGALTNVGLQTAGYATGAHVIGKGVNAIADRVSNSAVPPDQIDLSTQEDQQQPDQPQEGNPRQARIDYLTQQLSQIDPKSPAGKIIKKNLAEETFMSQAGASIDQLTEAAQDAKDNGVIDLHDELIVQRNKILDKVAKIHAKRDDVQTNMLGQTTENLDTYQNGQDSGTDPTAVNQPEPAQPAPYEEGGTDPAALQDKVDASTPEPTTIEKPPAYEEGATDPAALQEKIESTKTPELIEAGNTDPAALQDKVEAATGKSYIEPKNQHPIDIDGHPSILTSDADGVSSVQPLDQPQASSNIGKTSDSQRPIPKAQVQTIADHINNRSGAKANVVVHDSFNDLPQHLQERFNGKPVLGIQDHGTIHIIADQMKSVDMAKETMIHELWHYGGRKVFGPDFAKAMDQFATARKDLVEAKLNSPEYKGTFSKDPIMARLQAADEVLAELAQSEPKNSFVQHLVAMIKQKLREWGVLNKDKLSDAEIIRKYIDPVNHYLKSDAGASHLKESSLNDPQAAMTQAEKNERFTGLMKEATAKDAVKTRLNALKTGSSEIWDSIQKTFSPESRTEKSAITARLIRETGASGALENDRNRALLNDAAETMRHFTKNQSLEFINGMESGKTFSDSRLQTIASSLRNMLKAKYSEATKVDPDAMNKYLENYFPHIWKNSEEAIKAFNSEGIQKRLEGNKAFQKTRILPTIEFGMKELGLEPITFNPVEMTLLKMQEMDKFILGRKAVGEMVDTGLAKRFDKGETPPLGYKKLDGVIGKIFFPENIKLGELQSRSTKGIGKGDWYVPEDVAQVLSNHLSPGLRSNAGFRGYLYLSNKLNQAQLGLSAFHLGFTTLDAATSQVALAIEYGADGKMLRAGKEFAAALWNPLLPVVDTIARTKLSTGSKVLDEWYHPGSQGAEIARIVEGVRVAGGRAGLDGFYQTHEFNNMVKAYQDGNVIKGLINSPIGVVHGLSKVIMEQIVPRQKMQVFAKLMQKEFEKIDSLSDKVGLVAEKDEVRKVAASIWDSVDNRMGQMVYDNLFWNKTAKDLALASTRSLGWNIGTFRELLGGVKDFASLPFKEKKELTHRMSYTMALPLTVGIVGATLTRIFTGEWPKELTDYFFPPTGEKDINGKPLRLSLPSYMKDVYQFTHQPGTTLVNKANPLISELGNMMNNKDFYGTEIRHPDDPYAKQGLELLQYAAKQTIPFGIRNAMQENNTNASTATEILGFFGVSKAPYWLEQTKAEQMASDIVQQRLPVGARTQAQFDKSQLEHEIINGLQSKDDSVRTAAVAKQSQAVMDHQFTAADLKKIHTKVTTDPLTSQIEDSRLTASDALRIYKVGTHDEQEKIKQLVLGKIIRSQGLSPEDRQEMIQQLNGNTQ